jgi:hypothetical protein
MCEELREWARRETVVENRTVATVNAVWAQALGSNPNRWCILLPPSPNSYANFFFGDTQPTVFTFGITGGGTLWRISEDDVGSLITYPLWVRYNTTSGNLMFTTLSYNPERKKIYDSHFQRFLVRSGTL